MASTNSTRESSSLGSLGYLGQTRAANKYEPCNLGLMSKVVEVLEDLSLVQTVDIVRIEGCCRTLRDHMRRAHSLWRELRVPEFISWESLSALISRSGEGGPISIIVGKSARLWAELGYGFRQSNRAAHSGLTIESLFDRVGHFQRIRRIEWYKSVVSGDAVLKLCQSRERNVTIQVCAMVEVTDKTSSGFFNEEFSGLNVSVTGLWIICERRRVSEDFVRGCLGVLDTQRKSLQVLSMHMSNTSWSICQKILSSLKDEAPNLKGLAIRFPPKPRDIEASLAQIPESLARVSTLRSIAIEDVDGWALGPLISSLAQNRELSNLQLHSSFLEYEIDFFRKLYSFKCLRKISLVVRWSGARVIHTLYEAIIVGIIQAEWPNLRSVCIPRQNPAMLSSLHFTCQKNDVDLQFSDILLL